MDYRKILKFKGTWRSYQARVLEHVKQYMKDDRVHIVAAPGSGKTTLGIELIGRMGEVALILTPSITIREQWVARIAEGFLCDGLLPEDYISQDLKNPRCITVATYQALHSAMTKYKGILDESGTTAGSLESDDKIARSGKDSEEVDYTGFDLISEMKNAGVGVICLDECHHLRSEWWKALEEFRQALGKTKLIALTATPPYDSTPAMWKRYMDMCGEIDEEIAIPELVKEGSLCPHQDFVYLNYPTKEEMAEIERFKERSSAMQQRLLTDQEFLNALMTHGGLTGAIPDEELSQSADYLTALLVFLQEKKVSYPEHLRRLCGSRALPKLNAEWLEMLLQGFLYEDADSYGCDKAYREGLADELKAQGLIEKKQVCFVGTEAIEKLLTTSKGKCNSIKEIAASEYQCMGKGLRMLILADFIRKEYEKAVGNPASDVTNLGVLPFFEQLRRETVQGGQGANVGQAGAEGRQGATAGQDDAGKAQGVIAGQAGAGRGQTASGRLAGMRLGVLCGTIVIIPAEAKEALLTAIGDSGKVTFSALGELPETDYVKVTPVGDNHFLTAAVTEVFTQGHMQVLIGTKSLLGEGWDSPCINSLILASFVGAFMLSNQMRGRAIRVFKAQPDKTSNIWHLVCVLPQEGGEEEAGGQDFKTLKRRMENFLGLHYTEDVIENGMDRLSVLKAPYDRAGVERMDREMLQQSMKRAELKPRWDRALSKAKKMDIVDETTVEESCVSKDEYKKSLRGIATAGVGVAAGIALGLTPLGIIGGAVAVGSGLFGLTKIPKTKKLSTPENRLKTIGEGVYLALSKQNLLEEKGSSVKVEEGNNNRQAVYLTGGSGRDKLLFAKCIREFFSAVNDQRYLLVKNGNRKGEDAFYCIPECFARKKEDAELFYSYLKPYIGSYDLVYTRNENGKKLLLEGRMKSLADAKERSKTHKTVKSA